MEQIKSTFCVIFVHGLSWLHVSVEQTSYHLVYFCVLTLQPVN